MRSSRSSRPVHITTPMRWRSGNSAKRSRPLPSGRLMSSTIRLGGCASAALAAASVSRCARRSPSWQDSRQLKTELLVVLDE